MRRFISTKCSGAPKAVVLRATTHPVACHGSETPHQGQEPRTTDTRSRRSTAFRPLDLRWLVEQRSSPEWMSCSNSSQGRNMTGRLPVGSRLDLEHRMRIRSMTSASYRTSDSSLDRRRPAWHNGRARRARRPGGPPMQTMRAPRLLLEWRTSYCGRTLDACDRTINSKNRVSAVPHAIPHNHRIAGERHRSPIQLGMYRRGSVFGSKWLWPRGTSERDLSDTDGSYEYRLPASTVPSAAGTATLELVPCDRRPNRRLRIPASAELGLSATPRHPATNSVTSKRFMANLLALGGAVSRWKTADQG